MQHGHEIFSRQAGAHGLGNVTNVAALPKLAVHEGVNVAELELDGRLDVVVANDPPVVVDDPQPPFEIAPMIVGQFENEQFVENRVVHGILET